MIFSLHLVIVAEKRQNLGSEIRRVDLFRPHDLLG
jgi:hypothetical protein